MNTTPTREQVVEQMAVRGRGGVVTTGAIIAMGGGTVGESINSYQAWETDLPVVDGRLPITTNVADRLAVASTGKHSPRVLVVSTASEDGRHDVDLLVKALTEQYVVSLGAERLRAISATGPELTVRELAELRQADLVYVLGGNTEMMMERWRANGFDVALHDAWRQGTVMAGNSAGAICWAEWGCSNSWYTGKPFRVSGLGWLANTIVCPHYDSEPFRQEAFWQMLSESHSSVVGVALGEGAALHIDPESRTLTAIQMQPGAYPVQLCRVAYDKQRHVSTVPWATPNRIDDTDICLRIGESTESTRAKDEAKSAEEAGRVMTEPLPPLQSMILEVLASRHRLGETLWTFDASPSVVRALTVLEGSGLVETMTGMVEHTVRASLTDAGRSRAMSGTYRPPIVRAITDRVRDFIDPKRCACMVDVRQIRRLLDDIDNEMSVQR